MLEGPYITIQDPDWDLHAASCTHERQKFMFTEAERAHMDMRRPRTKKHFTFHHARCEHGHFLLGLQIWTSAFLKENAGHVQSENLEGNTMATMSVGSNKHK